MTTIKKDFLNDNKKTILFILIAFVFSIAVRLIWVYQFSDAEQFKFNNQFMINTNDGYFWAEGARDIVSGVSQENDRSPISTATSQLTAFLVKVLPFSFETIIFYMPAFFSSLIVIPIILIGRSIGKLEVGFIAALLASITWSYYNRTMVGYYDTDFLNIVFPTILLWSLIWAIKTKEDKYLLFTAVDIIAYRWWYPQSYSLEFAFFGLLALYIIYEKIKKEDINYLLQLITIMLLSMVNIDMFLRIALVFGYFMLFRQVRWHKHLPIMLITVFILFLASGGFDPIFGKLKSYVFKDAISVVGEDMKLHFYTVMQTIREANTIPFETFANRISGHTVTFLASIIGYIWLSIRNPIMLLGLPMIGLGFLAYSGGLRFTIYAISLLSLGIGFLIIELSNMVKNSIIKYSIITILTILVLMPNIKHIIEYKVPTVFTKNEVEVLDKLKSIASREDYVVGWWDYGYPIRYYSDVKTLSDGGKHSGSVNFPTSFILTNPIDVASKMLRLDVEYTEQTFALKEVTFGHATNKLNKEKEDSKKIKRMNNIGQMTLDYGYNDTNDFLDLLQTDIKLPKSTRDIYLYLPSKMLNIYPTIELFSNIDLMNGKKEKPSFFYKSHRFKESKEFIDLGQGIKLSKRTGKLHIGNSSIPIKRFGKTYYDKNGKLQTKIDTINSSSTLNVIYMSNYKQFLVVDDKVYNSLYFQLFVLENNKNKFFEPIILTPLAKVYKLRI
ncbi:MAG: STT3 domain-containing protein [Campylobacterota bacterium]|nr:STT3 domain-containing protein [Campylobacterota bacterium]